LSLEGDIARGTEAQALLTDGLEATLEELRDDCVMTWRSAEDLEERERMWHQMVAIDSLQTRLHGHVQRGRVATEEIVRQNEDMHRRSAQDEKRQRQEAEVAEARERLRVVREGGEDPEKEPA
jgi:hypothetical protein